MNKRLLEQIILPKLSSNEKLIGFFFAFHFSVPIIWHWILAIITLSIIVLFFTTFSNAVAVIEFEDCMLVLVIILTAISIVLYIEKYWPTSTYCIAVSDKGLYLYRNKKKHFDIYNFEKTIETDKFVPYSSISKMVLRKVFTPKSPFPLNFTKSLTLTFKNGQKMIFYIPKYLLDHQTKEFLLNKQYNCSDPNYQ